MQKVTVNTHTKGKNSQPFSYEAVGKFVTQEVKDRETKEVKQVVTLVSDGIVTDYDEAVNYLRDLHLAEAQETFKGEEDEAKREGLIEGFLNQAIIDALVSAGNREARRQASPTAEYDKVDELSPIVDKLVEGGFLQAENVKNWRTAVAYAAKGFDWTKLVAASNMKEYKAAVKAGVTF